MYSVNGIPLHNPAKQWRLLGDTNPFSALAANITRLSHAGFDGYEDLGASFEAPSLAFVIETPRANLDQLYALFLKKDSELSLTDVPGRVIRFQTESISANGWGAGDYMVDVTVLISLSTVWWRDIAESTSAPATLGGLVTVNVFPGISAPIRDAIIRVKGETSGFQVTDSQGAFFKYTANLTQTQYVRFHSDTGRAFLTSSDSWTGGTEVTDKIDYGPTPFFFEITPSFTDPSNRVGELAVQTSSNTARIQVRGRNSYVITE